jgi:hypothetical protein
LASLRHGGDVDHFERRIGRAFQEEHLGVRLDRLFPVGEVGAVDSVHSMPYFGASVSTTQRQEPNSARAATMWSPALSCTGSPR